MPYGYLGVNPNQRVKNSGILDVTDAAILNKDGNWGGSLELIQSQTVSGVTQIDFTSINENEYDVHFMEYNVKPSADCLNYMRFSNDNGSSFEANNYAYAFHINDAAGGAGETKSTASTQIYLNYGGGNSANEKHMGYYYFYNLGNSSEYSYVTEQANTQSSTGSLHSFLGGGVYKVAETINGIRLYPSTGNITGVINLYGVKQT